MNHILGTFDLAPYQTSCISKTAGCRGKRIEIWDSLVLVWGTFDLSVRDRLGAYVNAKLSENGR